MNIKAVTTSFLVRDLHVRANNEQDDACSLCCVTGASSAVQRYFWLLKINGIMPSLSHCLIFLSRAALGLGLFAAKRIAEKSHKF